MRPDDMTPAQAQRWASAWERYVADAEAIAVGFALTLGEIDALPVTDDEDDR